MKTLLPAIRSVIQGVMPRPSDCYITPNVNYMPTGTRQPCIGIKDAGISREELAGEMVEITATVELVGFVQMSEDGFTALCGNGGVFQLLDTATDALINNLLGLPDVQRVEIGQDSPSTLSTTDTNQFLVMMTRTLIYTLERNI